MIELSYMFGGKTCSISRDSIVAALKRYDAHTSSSTTRKGRKYFVWWQDQPYPPKEILRNVKGGPKAAFSGGRATNQVFVDLEFHVGKHKFPKRIEGRVLTPGVA